MLLHEDALEMIDFVLEDARGEIIEFEVEFFAVEVVALYMNLGGSEDFEMQAWN